LTAPEVYTVVLVAIAATFCSLRVPGFLDAAYLFDRSSLYIEVGLMALGMTFVIVGGHIDLSVSSTLALSACVSATLMKLGIPTGVAVAVVLAMGAVLGGVNGWVVTMFRMPALVVTLATMAMYRGLAQVLAGDHSLPLPAGMVGIDRFVVAGTGVPVPLAVLAVAAVALGLLLHRTVFGRRVLAMGVNVDAARYAGMPVAETTMAVFVMSGVLASVGGLLMGSRLGVARYDYGTGMELDAITAVVLGGASIFGGRGTIFGTMIALTLIAVLQTGMGVADVKAEYQQTANGALLIFAVLLSNMAARWRT
jgi:rhamnose transport system permease protein